MAEKLTPQQAQAVHDRGGKLLVSAAAGSGKTKVLVDRLLDYLCDPIHPANIDEFLMITYTKAAAAELRGKIAAKLSERIAQSPENRHLQRQMQRLYLTKISTVHAFCADLLREFAYRLDIPAGFRVADETECIVLRERVMDEILNNAYSQDEPDADFHAFLDTQGFGRTDRLVPEIVQHVYDSSCCHLNPGQWLQQCLYAAKTDSISDASETLWGQYLINDLFRYLDLQICAFNTCIEAAAAEPKLSKPVTLLQSTIQQLKDLRSSSSWDDIARKRKIDYGRLYFPKNVDNPELVSWIKGTRSACKEGLEKKLTAFTESSDQVLKDLEQSEPGLRGMIALVNRFSDAYARIKRNRRILDFADLEHKTLDLLLGKNRSTITSAANEIAERFREIMVDEYQDSNVVQDAIFSALTQKKQNLFMVGDVKQSIYQFRLADPGIFLEKYATFVSADNACDGQGRKVLLTSNFRSGGGVIAAVNDVFSDCMSPEVGGLVYGEDEALREGVPHVTIPEAEVEFHAIQIQSDTYAEEANFVADKILQLLDGTHMVRQADSLRPIKAEDIVILLRSPGSVGHQFQKALHLRGIRSTAGGGIDLLQTEEIAVLRALLQTISNPRQDIPLVSVLASPIFGFTAQELATVRSSSRYCTFYESLQFMKDEKSIKTCITLKKLREEVGVNTLTGLIEQVLLLTRMDSIYAAMPGGATRSANIHAFFQLASEYETRGGKGLDAFLDYLQSLDEKGLVVGGETSLSGAVTIMSIHKSKGLEFPVVFLCGLSRRFNREDLRAQVLCHKEMGIGLSCVDIKNRVRYPTIAKRAIAVRTAAESLSEELRVLYVAMTRARDRLIMTYASSSLEADINSIVSRMDRSNRILLTSAVTCPGEWVLLSALSRIEASALFSMCGRPGNLRVSSSPWKITVADAVDTVVSQNLVLDGEGAAQEVTATEIPALNFHYIHSAATATPSKLTATQKKGRYKDLEAAEDAQCEPEMTRVWRKPSFIQRFQQGTEYGRAIHTVLQYIRYEVCTNVQAVQEEINRLIKEGFVSEENGRLADCTKIANFFNTSVGQKLRTGTQALREFKFSILDDASTYNEQLDGERILLQGVVDCALLENDGITVIDFKTDYVTEENLQKKIDYYFPQVQAYASALSRIYGMKVKASYLYFFHLDRLIPVIV